MFYGLLINALATWRVSHMLVHEDGPYEVFKNLRKGMGFEYDIDGDIIIQPTGSIFSCIYCMSVWVAPIFMVAPAWISKLFAVSALAVILHEIRPNR